MHSCIVGLGWMHGGLVLMTSCLSSICGYETGMFCKGTRARDDNFMDIVFRGLILWDRCLEVLL